MKAGRRYFKNVGLLVLLPGAVAWGQEVPAFPVSSEQRATAKQVAESGVPLSELVPNAPERYTVKAGDTLWGIASLFLRNPWRWPELWGMNLSDIANPHLIYPGQALTLVRQGDRAQLAAAPAPAPTLTNKSAPKPQPIPAMPVSQTAVVTVQPDLPTERLSPQVRSEPLPELVSSLPTLAIEATLAEPLIIDVKALKDAPRIVASHDDHVLMAPGDRVYARGTKALPLTYGAPSQRAYRVFRNPRPLKDPQTGEVLAYEADLLGEARLVSGESDPDKKTATPAAVDIVSAKGDIKVGDRLFQAAPPERLELQPRAPDNPVQARILGIYGERNAELAGQNQVVALNKGKDDGLAPGDVMAIAQPGERLRTRSGRLQLPPNRKGLLMVFRVYDKVSYGLITELRDAARVGDALMTP